MGVVDQESLSKQKKPFSNSDRVHAEKDDDYWDANWSDETKMFLLTYGFHHMVRR